MFAKIHAQILDSSIADDYQKRDVFQDMLILSDRNGVVDMTHEAIAARTRRPIEIVKAKIVELMEPDPASRSYKANGARLVLLDPEQRTWGWRIVNHAHYRNLRNEDERNRFFRGRQRRHFVYYAVDGDQVRLGLSVNPWGVVKTLKKTHPEITLAARERGDADLLRQRQREFSGDSINGNWFKLTAKLQDHIAAVAVTDHHGLVKLVKKVATVSHRLATVSQSSQVSHNSTYENQNSVSHRLVTVSQGLPKNGHTDAEADAYNKILSLKGAPVGQGESNIMVQHPEAKRTFGRLSADVFGKSLPATQWPSDMEHYLDAALPMREQDLGLIDWFYRLPVGHPIFTVTRRRQSMHALIENLDSEVQKVKSAQRLLELKKETAAENEPDPEEPEEDWTRARVAATRELFPGVAEDVFARPYAHLAGDVVERIEGQVKKWGGKMVSARAVDEF